VKKRPPEQHILDMAKHLAEAARICVENGTLENGVHYRLSYTVCVKPDKVGVQHITAEPMSGAVQ
jgi:hypothetical protein